MTEFKNTCIKDYKQQLILAGYSEDEAESKINNERKWFERSQFFGNDTGGCLFLISNGKVFLFYILVYQKGEGNGKVLLKQFEESMKEKDVESVSLNVFEHNVVAKNLYKDYYTISSLMEKRL